MNLDVTTRTDIAAPLSSRWYVSIKSVESQTPRPIGIGSRFAFVAQLLGRRLAYVCQVVEYVPDRRLVMRTADGPFPMETTYEWEPIETGTRMTLRNRGTPSGFSGIAAPFMSAAMRRANRKDLAALKALLEAK